MKTDYNELSEPVIRVCDANQVNIYTKMTSNSLCHITRMKLAKKDLVLNYESKMLRGLKV